MTENIETQDLVEVSPGVYMVEGAMGEGTATVPLVSYHKDRKVVIGHAIVDLKTLETKGHVEQAADKALSEVTGTVFTFGGENVRK